MIRSLTGTIAHQLPTGVIVDVAGVGYLVAVPLRVNPTLHSVVTLFTHHHVREQEQSLYGFLTLDELAAFESLLAVSGIGPKSALAILSIASADQLTKALETDDVSFFASIPGSGKKTAAKIIVELKGKLAPASTSGSTELRDALAALGYGPRDLGPLLQVLPPELTETRLQLNWILRQLGQR